MNCIAIDGPAGAGKSTIARKAAAKLGFIYVDTGAMYRAMALFFQRMHTDLQDAAAVRQDAENADISIAYQNGGQVVLLNGENVNDFLRTEEVSRLSSVVSTNGDVRKKLVELQQRLAASTPVVMDGRDIGTVVLPGAVCKIYLTASVRVRANRRLKEEQAGGTEVSLEEIEKDIRERDYRDMHREISPLRQADDAVLVDTSDMTVAEVTERIIGLYREAAQKAGFPIME